MAAGGAGGFGGAFVSIALTFFVFTTLMAYYFYSESSILYLCQGSPRAEKILVRVLQAMILAAIVFGSAREANLVSPRGRCARCGSMRGRCGGRLAAFLSALCACFLAAKGMTAPFHAPRRHISG